MGNLVLISVVMLRLLFPAVSIFLLFTTRCSSSSSPVAPAPNSASLPQIWYGSTPLATDIGQMYLDPSSWSHTQSYTHAIKFYSQQMTYDCPPAACGFANLTYFQQVGAFPVLQKHGLKIAIEGGALKDWDCMGPKCLNAMETVIRNLNVTRVDYIDMDEPYFAGVHWCKISMQEAAQRVVSNFMEPLRKMSPYSISIGDIEPYPALSADQILSWLDELKSLGAGLTHFHIDVDFHAVGHKRKALAKARTDFLRIREYCDANHLTFATIMNPAGFGPTTDEAYYDATMQNVRWWIENLGRPAPGYPSSRVIFQSWEPRGVPSNVPETGSYTGTKVLLDSVDLFLKG